MSINSPEVLLRAAAGLPVARAILGEEVGDA